MQELTLNVNDKIRIGDNLLLIIMQKKNPKYFRSNQIKIGIEAPREIHIYRGELLKKDK